MQDLLDLDRYPIDRGAAAVALAERCRRDLADTGMFNLDGLVRPEALRRAVQEITPLTSSAAFTHQRLIRAAEEGGEFQYHSNLRSDDAPNYEGVGKLLQGEDSGIRVNPLEAGTLNIFAGKNTLHRVSTVRGACSRLVAVFSYYDRPGVTFSEKERRGF